MKLLSSELMTEDGKLFKIRRNPAYFEAPPEAS